jgi:hypothetical protein
MSKYQFDKEDYRENKPVSVRKFKTRQIFSFNKNDIWSVDLAVYREDEKEKKGQLSYVLNCVDIFSRKAYSAPISDRTDETITNALYQIFIKHKVMPKKIYTDKEFSHKKIKDFLNLNNIEQYSVDSFGTHNPIVESFNRTMRMNLSKLNYKTSMVENLNKFISVYNKTKHSGIYNKTPNDVNENEELSGKLHVTNVMKNFFNDLNNKDKEKFKLGEEVYYVINNFQNTRFSKMNEKYFLSKEKYKIIDIK